MGAQHDRRAVLTPGRIGGPTEPMRLYQPGRRYRMVVRCGHLQRLGAERKPVSPASRLAQAAGRVARMVPVVTAVSC